MAVFLGLMNNKDKKHDNLTVMTDALTDKNITFIKENGEFQVRINYVLIGCSNLYPNNKKYLRKY